MRALRALVIVLVAALAAVAASSALAEVSGTPRDGGRVDFLIMTDGGITDGIDPISDIWHPYRPLPAEWVLNPSGESRGDGRPAVAYERASGAPVVVWAYRQGASHDIAMAHWQGDGWSPTELITNTPYDELDPRAFVRADGTLYVVWWVDGPDPRVELISRTTDGDTGMTPMTPLRVSPFGEPARRPSVTHFDGAIWVAYERDATESTFDTSEIALRRQNAGGTFVLERLAETAYAGPVDPLLHVQNGHFWMDWRYATEQFAYAEIDEPEQGGANLEAWEDCSWVGIESVRLLIAHLVGTAP